MSQKGKYLRGQKWYDLFRDRDGNLDKSISNDPHKMVDVNVYLETIAKEKENRKETKSKGRK